MSDAVESIHTSIWEEVPEADNPFVARACYCRGYDVFGEILEKASWTEYLFLLFSGERPSQLQARLLERLAVALANPGLRDHSVRAAMTSGVGGSTNAASLIAALGVGAGGLGGAREVYRAVEYWTSCGTDIELWKETITNPAIPERADIWTPAEHSPGFDPHGSECSKPVLQVLDSVYGVGRTIALGFLKQNRRELEETAKLPLAIPGVAAAALFDLGFSADQAEMLFLFLRLPGAAVHALEQKKKGWKKYPFFHNGIELTNDPARSE